MNYTNKNELIINKYINKNIFNNPIYILKSEIKYDNNVQKENSNNILMSTVSIDSPKVYIYNSHQKEEYSYKYLEEYNIIPNVLMASNMLKDKLENLGINTLVEENDITKYMEENNLDHSGSYIASRYFLTNTMNKYNSIELFIDLHRDAASYEATHTIIDGKDYAKVLFVVGGEYDTYLLNKKVEEDINNIINEKYPTLSRGILKNEGWGKNGVYNQDLNSNIILIEVGSNYNNIDEVNNTLDALAIVIGEYLNEKEKI